MKVINMSHFTTDAVLSTLYKITVDDLNVIDRVLDQYEKISMSFLLFEDATQALNYFYDGNQNILTAWAAEEMKNSSNSHWQNKILEALCIIQNYSVLKKLGFNKDELIKRFIPNNPNSSLYVPLIRKVLYITCETLTSQQNKLLIQHLREDFQEKHIPFPNFPEKYLELYFLHCFSVNYINSTDFSNLARIFKLTGLENNNYIISLVGSIDYKEEHNAICQDNIRDSLKFGNSKKASNTWLPDTHPCYRMERNNAGICVIINQEKFTLNKKDVGTLKLPLSLGDKPLKPRYGTDVDKRKLQETFEYFGFRTYLFDNLNHEDILLKITEAMKNFTSNDCCFIVCILSHGEIEKVFGADCIPVSISEIETTVHDTRYVNLLNKPKIVIIQSCQGDQLLKVVDMSADLNTTDGHSEDTWARQSNTCRTDDSRTTPERCDLLVCTSSIPGFASIRNEQEGSWYVQELCKVLREQAHRLHFQDMLIRVNDHVTRLKWLKDGRTICMVPDFRTSFRKSLYLLPPDSHNNL